MKPFLSRLFASAVILAVPATAFAQFAADSSAPTILNADNASSENGVITYITPDQEVRGDKGVYTRADESFVVTGDVVLLQDDSVVTGNRLNYNLQTREANVAGDCKGRKCGKGRRVSILIRSTDTAQGTN